MHIHSLHKKADRNRVPTEHESSGVCPGLQPYVLRNGVIAKRHAIKNWQYSLICGDFKRIILGRLVSIGQMGDYGQRQIATRLF
jgi:hypothetical protein